ncbi:MAG TPA: TonB-dependent receptor [Thermoanaerobaculia bacterium]|nr:TonB-dependent receptor [Thermoanaerobaculia bacterium]
MRRFGIVLILVLSLARESRATIFGSVRGSVKAADGAAVAGARVTLRAQSGSWKRAAIAGADGAFAFSAVPLGEYGVRAEAGALVSQETRVAVTSGGTVAIDLTVAPPSLSERMTVTAEVPAVDPRSSTTQTTVSRLRIAQTPGADSANSVAMITAFVPGSYVVHDQLHVRGGHQVDWLVDGVPVPNTNIASNVGPQFDPKDVDYIEVQRGGYSAEYGDRTYAILNVVPRTGFERDREGDLALGFGTYKSAISQLSLGDHSERFAYYVSLNANRSDLGLETPVPQVLHDNANGFGAFASLVFEPRASDQLRVVASARRDDYQIPNDGDAQAAGIRDLELEHDLFANLSWLHIAGPWATLTVSPFFHDNSARFDGGSDDPIVAADHRTSRYAGAQVTVVTTAPGHDARIGAFGFIQNDDELFSLTANGVSLSQRQSTQGNLQAIFVEDRYDMTPWLTMRGGLRYTRFSGGLRESAASPRTGLSIRLPGSNTVVRASYGHYYQAPPLSTVSGPLLQYALEQGFGFLPLRGERDHQGEIGIATTAAGWTLDASAFRTEARNFFDHDVLGNSNIFFPLTIDRVHIRGVEATLKSPLIAGRADVHAAFSHQTVQGEGGVAGGLTDFSPPKEGRFFLDHDQRNTASAGITLRLPRASWISGAVAYGSGFLQGNGPAHLPSHTTFDVAAGTTAGLWSLKITALNVANKRYLLDESNTFGGTHYANPRAVSAQIGYRFKY